MHSSKISRQTRNLQKTLCSCRNSIYPRESMSPRKQIMSTTSCNTMLTPVLIQGERKHKRIAWVKLLSGISSRKPWIGSTPTWLNTKFAKHHVWFLVITKQRNVMNSPSLNILKFEYPWSIRSPPITHSKMLKALQLVVESKGWRVHLVIIVGGTIGSVNKAKLEEVLECMNVRKGAWQAANGREAPTRHSLNSFNQTTASALKFEKSRRGQRESSLCPLLDKEDKDYGGGRILRAKRVTRLTPPSSAQKTQRISLR